MTHAQIIEALVAAGATVKVVKGQARLVGEVPDEVLEAIRADRDGFLESWQSHERDRWDKCPPLTQPLRSSPPYWRDEVYRRVERYVRHQSDAVTRWAFDRGCQYRELGWSVEDACKASFMDVLAWQLARFADPVTLLQDLDDVVRDWKR